MKKENQVPENQIKPHLVTKPIQLLATWLLGLTIVNSSFLTAADYITSPEWAPGALVIAAICYVPLFLISLFLLQTKFRPEMQEDSYYSDYLRNKNSDTANKINEDDIKKHAEKLAENIMVQVSTVSDNDRHTKKKKVAEIIELSEVNSLAKRFSNNRTLSELFLYSELWDDLVDEWGSNPDFKEDVMSLKKAGILTYPSNHRRKAKFTVLGEAVANMVSEAGELWNDVQKKR